MVIIDTTSDIPFENLKVKGNKNIFDLFPDIIFMIIQN